jgi:hypothetical protein
MATKLPEASPSGEDINGITGITSVVWGSWLSSRVLVRTSMLNSDNSADKEVMLNGCNSTEYPNPSN